MPLAAVAGLVNVVAPGQLVGGGHLLLLPVDPPEDVVLQHLGNLQIDQGLVI